MGYPQQPQQGGPPQGQPGPHYGPPQPPYPPQPYGAPQQPMHVRQVGKSVTKPAWTIGDVCWIVFTAGMAWPIIWLKRRRRTTVTRHR